MTPEPEAVWVGLAYMSPFGATDDEAGRDAGGFGFAAMRAATIDEAVRLLRLELAEAGSDLIGFEWIGRLQDYYQALDPQNAALVDRLDEHPVQYHHHRWHPGHAL